MDGSLVIAGVGVVVSGGIGLINMRKNTRIEVNVDGNLSRMQKKLDAQQHELDALKGLSRAQSFDRVGDPSAAVTSAANTAIDAAIDTENASRFPRDSTPPASGAPERATGPENP